MGTARLKGDRAGQSARRAERCRAGAEKEERTGAIGALGQSRLETTLGNQRRLLIHGQTRDRDVGAKRVRVPDHLSACRQARHGLKRESEELERFGGPLPCIEVEDQRARRCGHVGHELAGELVE